MRANIKDDLVRCPLCNSRAARYFVLTHTSIWRCKKTSCRLQFAWPQLNNEQLSQAYEQLYYPKDTSQAHIDPTSDIVFEQFFDAFKNKYPSIVGKRLLDYGCGPATFARVASKYGMHPTGIEIDAEAREQVRAAGVCEVYADLAELVQKDPSARFHWIVLWNVIEHLRYPWLEIQKLQQLCALDSHLIVVTPNADCLRSRIAGSKWDQRLNLTHFYYFTRTSLTATLKAAGFSNVVTHSEFTAYPHHGVLRRSVQKVLVACRLDGKLEFSAAPMVS